MPAFLLPILLNWKTTLAGAIPVVIAVAQTVGVAVPGVPHVDPVAAIWALIFGAVAKDGNK